MDGLSANDDAAGLSGISYGVDAVEQFQVVTSGGQAELGRALGGYINVVTKSGTNVCHGDCYGYFRDDRFNAPNALSGNEAADEPGAVRGQPRRPDRARPHLLLRERRAAPARSDRPRHDLAGERARVINARLAAVGYQGPLIATGVYPNPVDTTQRPGEGRSPVQRPSDQFGVRYSLYDVDGRELARRRRAERAERVGRSGQHRPDDRGQQRR